MQAQRRHVLLAVLVAALLHGGVLAGVQFLPTPPAATPLGAVQRFTLTAPQPASAPVEAAPTPTQPPVPPTPAPAPGPVPKPKPAAAPPSPAPALPEPAPSPAPVVAPAETGPAPSVEPAPPAEPSAREQADYAAQLAAWLERHKDYPLMAKRRRLEGEAVLYVRIGRDGRVQAYRLERSSGQRILDAAVMAMVQRADPLPALPSDYPGTSFELRVPVRFRMR